MKRIGVDIGGTFTDIVVLDEETGNLQATKVPSTPARVADAAITGLREAVDTLDVRPKSVRFVAHGSTIGTNTVIQRTGAKTALLTTKGFRDVLEFARVARPAGFLYDVTHTMAEALVPRHLRKELTERVDADGKVVRALDVREIDDVCDILIGSEVEAVAICLIFSFLYPAHERRVLERIKERCPNVFVTISSALSPLYGEYERTSTAVVNGYIGPAFRRYLEVMSGHVERDLGTRLYLMQSNGGLLTSTAAQEQPVRALESGPTAGVMGAVHVAKLMKLSNVISFDMGGTTAKAGLIVGGQSVETVEYEVGGLAAAPGSGHLHGRGTGFPISLPAVEVTEVGSGGGSIGWIDAGGAFRVGPQSMGAHPGPACYGFGGEEPTVTDAQVVLGVINPKNFLGGKMELDPQLSVRAIETRIAKPLGMTVQQGAKGIIQIANAAMAQATRLVSINKGHDPREFALLAFGGAGPMHACDIARDLEIPWVIVPRHPGLHSALGLVVSDIVHDFIRAYTVRQLKTDVIERLVGELEESATRVFDADGVPAGSRTLVRTADLRYKGQTHTVNVSVPGGPVDERMVQTMVANFHTRHEALNTFKSPDATVELVNLRLRGIGVIPRPEVGAAEAKNGSVKDALLGRRNVFFTGSDEGVASQVFDRARLVPGHVISGPAIVEQLDTTAIVPPNMVGTVDDFQNLVIGREMWREPASR